MLVWSLSFLMAAATESGGGSGGLNIDPTSAIVALVSAMATITAAYFMFKGKTQDTANWLITELRNEAKLAKESAQECEQHREEDRVVMEDLRGNMATLTVGVRRLTRENEALKVQVTRLSHKIDELHPRVD